MDSEKTARTRGENSKPRLERVVVVGEDGKGTAKHAECTIS
jgi:hypothetical protein